MPPHSSTRMVLKAHLADGSEQVVITSGATLPDNWTEYIWPSVGARVVKYRQETMMRTSSGLPECIDAMCLFIQRRWDATHAPPQHIQSLEAYCAFEEIVPIELAGTYQPGGGEALIHTWRAQLPSK